MSHGHVPLKDEVLRYVLLKDNIYEVASVTRIDKIIFIDLFFKRAL